MYEVSYAVLNFCMVITTIWIVNKFLNIFLHRKKINIICITLWILFCIFQFCIQYNVGNASGWVTIAGIIFMLIIAHCNFYSIGKRVFFVVIFFYVIGALIEMIVFYTMDVLYIPSKEANIIGQVISKILMIIAVYAISNFWKKEDTSYLPTKIYVTLFVIPVGSIYIAIQTFFSMSDNNNLVSAMIIFCILLGFNVVIFEIYSKLIQTFTFEKEKTIYVQQMDIISRNTEEQKRIIENFHEEKHNLVNELIILKHNLECSDSINLMNNLNQIIQVYEDTENISSCGNNIIDAIINFKYTLAKERGIIFSLKIFVPEELPFNQCDIGIVLGNALDNAIDAITQYKNEDEKKEIEIVMGVKKEAFIMLIKNPYYNEIKKDKNGNLISTKRDSAGHGYGVRSIKKVVEKYGGEVIIDTKNNIFSLIVTINI